MFKKQLNSRFGLINNNANNRELFNNISGSFIIKGIALGISLFTMPAYLHYFEDERVLGVWFTVISILNWILTFDLGIGNGLRNNLVKAIYENDDDKAKKYISSAYIIIGLISTLVIFSGYIFIGILNWNSILNVSALVISNNVLIKTVRWIFIGIIFQFLLKLIISILNAMQKTALASSLSLISSVLLLVYILLFKGKNIETNLLNLAIVNILTINIPLLIATFMVFMTSLKNARPSFKSFEKKYAIDVVRLGGVFFWVQIAFMIISSTDQVIITSLFGPQYVVEYQMYYKIFWVYVSVFTLITNPIWSAVTKAYAEKRFKWIEKTYNIVKKSAVLLTMFCIGTVLILQLIFNIWLGSNTIEVNYLYAFVFSINASVVIYVMAESAIANGIGILKVQLYCYTLAAAIKIPLAFIASLFINDWIVVVAVNIIILLPYLIIQGPIIKKYLNNVENKL